MAYEAECECLSGKEGVCFGCGVGGRWVVVWWVGEEVEGFGVGIWVWIWTWA